MLILRRQIEESIMIGNNVEVKVLEIRWDKKNGCNVVRLGIVAPRNIQVHRKEVFLQIKEREKKNQ